MPVIETLLKLVSLLPARHLPTLYGLLSGLVNASSAKEREDKLRKAALSVGYKEGARQTMDAALRARVKL